MKDFSDDSDKHLTWVKDYTTDKEKVSFLIFHKMVRYQLSIVQTCMSKKIWEIVFRKNIVEHSNSYIINYTYGKLY